MSEDLRDKITAAIDRAEQVARRAYDAEPGPWALHHNATRYGRADEWEIRDYDGDSLAWVGAENDARLIIAAASPDVVLRRCAADRRVLERHQHNAVGRAPLGDEIHCVICGWVGGPGLSLEAAFDAGLDPEPWTGDHWCDEIRDCADRWGVDA